MLNSWEIASMRTTVESSLVDVCTIYRRVVGSDTYGGSASSGSVLAASVPCYLSPLTGQDQQIAGRTLGRKEQMLSLPHDQDVVVGDYITVTGKGQYEVLSVLGPESQDLYTHLMVGQTDGYGADE